MSATPEALRVLDGFERGYANSRSPRVLSHIVAGARLVLREAVGDRVDINELALQLAMSGMAVVAASLFDTTDAALQPLSARYREYLRADFDTSRFA